MLTKTHSLEYFSSYLNFVFCNYRIILFIGLLIFFVIPFSQGQIIGENAFLKNNSIELGLGDDGAFGSNAAPPSGFHPRPGDRLGYVVDPDEDGWDIGEPDYCGDFFVPGAPVENLSITIDDRNYYNNKLEGNVDIPGILANYLETDQEISVEWIGEIDSMRLRQKVILPRDDNYIILECDLSNLSSRTVNEVFFSRNVDPDNEQTLTDDFRTKNIVVSNPNATTDIALVTAVGLDFGCEISLGAVSKDARATFGGFANTNAKALYTDEVTFIGTVGDSMTADIAISVSWNLGSFLPGETKRISYGYLLDPDDIDNFIDDVTCFNPPVAMCQDQTINLNGTTSSFTSAMALDGGSTDDCGIISYEASQLSFTCDDLGDNMVTLIVTDEDGLSDTCISIVTVVDSGNPMMSCKDITIELVEGVATISPSDVDNGSTDNCTLTSLTLSQTSFGISNLGDNMIQLAGRDQANNLGVCFATVTVTDPACTDDMTPPELNCQSVFAELNINGGFTLSPFDISSGSTDNCDISDYVFSQRTFTCSDVGSNEVTLVALDPAGNADTCMVQVFIQDNTPPTIMCQDITLMLGSDASLTIDPDIVDNGTTDACGVDSLWLSRDEFDCMDIGMNSVTMFAVDIYGNVSMCTTMITIAPYDGPEICFDDIDNDCDGVVDVCEDDDIFCGSLLDLPSISYSQECQDSFLVIHMVYEGGGTGNTAYFYDIDAIFFDTLVIPSPLPSVGDTILSVVLDDPYSTGEPYGVVGYDFQLSIQNCENFDLYTMVDLSSMDCPDEVSSDCDGAVEDCCADSLLISDVSFTSDTLLLASDLISFRDVSVADGINIMTISSELDLQFDFTSNMPQDFQHINDDGCLVAAGCVDDQAHNYDLFAQYNDFSCETCYDGIQNGDESDIDCGGILCDACAIMCEHPDYDAMIEIYISLGGDNWTDNNGRSDGVIGNNCDPCMWYGVDCNSDGRVRRIDMDGLPDDTGHGGRGANNLRGNLPSSIGDLDQLEILILNDNVGVTGSLPASIGKLKKLHLFQIFNCSFSGVIPDSISQLSSIRSMQLSFNEFTGSLPSSMGDLTTLQALFVNSNNLTGTIPASFSNLSNLNAFWAMNNDMNGCFDLSLSTLCPNLSNHRISSGNNFESSWEDFCNDGSGECISEQCEIVLSDTRSTSLSRPHGATTDGTYYYLVNPSHRIDKVNKEGELISSFGSSSEFSFNSPQGISYHDGKLYIGDNGHDRIAVYDTIGTYLQDFDNGDLESPRMVYFYDNSIFVAQWSGGIIRYDLNGNVMFSFSTTGGFINGMAVKDDKIFACIGEDTLNIYDLNGSLLDTINYGGFFAAGIEFVQDYILLANPNNGVMLVYDLDGTLVNTLPDVSGWAMVKEGETVSLFDFSEIKSFSCE